MDDRSGEERTGAADQLQSVAKDESGRTTFAIIGSQKRRDEIVALLTVRVHVVIRHQVRRPPMLDGSKRLVLIGATIALQPHGALN